MQQGFALKLLLWGSNTAAPDGVGVPVPSPPGASGGRTVGVPGAGTAKDWGPTTAPRPATAPRPGAARLRNSLGLLPSNRPEESIKYTIYSYII